MAASPVGKLDVEVELKSPADKLWLSIQDSITVFPKALPHLYKSIQVVEGDGKSVGSVRLVTYADGSPVVTVAKEKIETVEEEKKTLSYSVVDGDLLKYYKTFKATLVVTPKGGGSLVKWASEFEKASEEIPNPDAIKDFAVKIFQDLDVYLKA
ncbi:hypothetical protein U1Q18_017013 [Sarracenia purpurea var. burkii]